MIDAIQNAKNWLDITVKDIGECCDLSLNEERNIKTIKFALEYLAQSIEDDWKSVEEAPHAEVVLLYWKDWVGNPRYEAKPYSQGGRNSLGVSNASRHGYATQWKPLNPLSEKMLNKFKKGLK